MKVGKKLYIITIAIFLLMVCFVDKNNLVERYRLHNEIRELELQKVYYLDQIKKDSLEVESLKSDSSLERIARELYLMKRKNETIFIVNEK
ncbi:MAG: septum formation initiator family protein [Rikenellaceae bacterium]|nr:septum formation initiator family protein [Rikenellaceae bacterium]